MITNRLCVIAATLSALLLVPAYADERTKEFPAQKCKVTLPGDDWSWVGDESGEAVATARNREGLILTVLALPARKGFYVRNSFIKGFDKGFFEKDSYEKRGGKLIKVKGVPCYQALFRFVEDKRTGALRVIGQNDFCYQVQLFGAIKPPVEKRRDFEAIMGSLEIMPAPSPVPGIQKKP